MDSDPTSNIDDPDSSHASIDLLDAHIDALLMAFKGNEVAGDYQNHVGDYHI